MQTQFFQDKSVLVAGGSGFIGTNLTERLSQLGARVRSTFYTRQQRFQIPGVEYVRANLMDEDACHEVTRDIDYVFMAAANSSGAAIIEETPLVHLTPNLVMNAQILAASYHNKVEKFCFISSNTVYPLTDYPVSEIDAKFDFFEKYFIVGWMKRFSEIMCEMYSSHIDKPMATLTVRPGNLYGPHDKFNYRESKVIAALVRRAIERENPFTVWGDGSDIKDFLYIEDFIDGMILAFENSKDISQINIASGIPISIYEAVGVILEKTGYSNAELKFDSSKPTMIPIRLMDTSKINELTGWMPKIDFETGILKTVSWYRKFYAEKSPEEEEL